MSIIFRLLLQRRAQNIWQVCFLRTPDNSQIYGEGQQHVFTVEFYSEKESVCSFGLTLCRSCKTERSNSAASLACGHPSNSDWVCWNLHQSTDTTNYSTICKQQKKKKNYTWIYFHIFSGWDVENTNDRLLKILIFQSLFHNLHFELPSVYNFELLILFLSWSAMSILITLVWYWAQQGMTAAWQEGKGTASLSKPRSVSEVITATTGGLLQCLLLTVFPLFLPGSCIIFIAYYEKLATENQKQKLWLNWKVFVRTMSNVDHFITSSSKQKGTGRLSGPTLLHEDLCSLNRNKKKIHSLH